jgi:hypothetical protein
MSNLFLDDFSDLLTLNVFSASLLLLKLLWVWLLVVLREYVLKGLNHCIEIINQLLYFIIKSLRGKYSGVLFRIEYVCSIVSVLCEK